MKLEDCKVDGSKHIKIDDMPTKSSKNKAEKPNYEKLTKENLLLMGSLQEKLYAESKEAVIVLLQAMDAAGKDSTIKHVMSGINPQGIDVYSFKQPSSEELAHDYLWRVNKALPSRGKMAIFNRSYYEDVLVVRVHNIQKSYQMSERCLDESADKFFERRYEQIRNYEEFLYSNSYRILKIFLHVSKDAQKKRFLERIDDESKNWKFSAGDLKERALWDDYMDAYEAAINATATKDNPWYVIPADQKWYTRYLVSQAVRETLEACNPQYPVLPQEECDQLASCRAQLMAE